MRLRPSPVDQGIRPCAVGANGCVLGLVNASGVRIFDADVADDADDADDDAEVAFDAIAIAGPPIASEGADMDVLCAQLPPLSATYFCARDGEVEGGDFSCPPRRADVHNPP